MTESSEVEKKWLCWARGVLECNGRPLTKCCCEVQVEAKNRDRIRRWPGYLGANYEKGRVLLVGAVHNENQLFKCTRENGESPMRALEKNVNEWRDHRWSDEAGGRYLPAMRTAYEASTSLWTGPVWRNFRYLMNEFGVDLKQVAFTNLAKCFLKPEPKQSRPKQSRPGPKRFDKVTTECNRNFPVALLVARIRPIAVLVAKGDAAFAKSTTLHTRSYEPPLEIRFNNSGQQAGNSRWPQPYDYATKRPIEEWGPEAAEKYRELMDKRASQ